MPTPFGEQGQDDGGPEGSREAAGSRAGPGESESCESALESCRRFRGRADL